MIDQREARTAIREDSGGNPFFEEILFTHPAVAGEIRYVRTSPRRPESFSRT